MRSSDFKIFVWRAVYGRACLTILVGRASQRVHSFTDRAQEETLRKKKRSYEVLNIFHSNFHAFFRIIQTQN